MAFAEVTDIEALWRELSDAESARASALIDVASASLATLVDVDEHDTQQAENLKNVCCSMVIRAMSATDADTFGVTSASMTAGPYTQQKVYSNPTGDMYLTKFEKTLLGIGAGYIGSIEANIDGYYGGN